MLNQLTRLECLGKVSSDIHLGKGRRRHQRKKHFDCKFFSTANVFHFLLFFGVEAVKSFQLQMPQSRVGDKGARTWYNLVGGSFKWSTSVTNLKAASTTTTTTTSTWFLCLSQMRESPKEKPELDGVHEKQKNLKRRRFASLSGLAAKKWTKAEGTCSGSTKRDQRERARQMPRQRETETEREVGRKICQAYFGDLEKPLTFRAVRCN